MTQRPELKALILAGGRGSRLGADKAAIEIGGTTQLERVAAVCSGAGLDVVVSVRPEQRSAEPFRQFEQVADAREGRGPLAGVVAAWTAHPRVAWLVIAVDLVLIDADTIESLLRARDTGRDATVFAHADGTLEPLCAIWEPGLAAAAARALEGSVRSPRRLLERSRIAVVEPPDASRIVSINTAAALESARCRLGQG